MKYALVLLLLTTSLAFAGTATITGTVVDEYGVPVPNFKVEAFPLDTGLMVGIPQALTNRSGQFEFTVAVGQQDERLYGMRWAVSPDQEGNYYPELHSGFYETANNHPMRVQFTPKHLQANVTVKLGPKAGALKIRTIDALSGALVNPAELEFAWASNPSNRMGGNFGNPCRVLLPANTDILLTARANGYEPWSYPGALNVGPGTDTVIDIQLTPKKGTQ